MAAFWLARGANARSHRRYEEAMALIGRAFGIFSTSEPSDATPLLANLLFADASHRVRANETAYYACEVVLRQCSTREQTARLKRAEIDFIKFQCKWILANLSSYRDSPAMTLAQSVTVYASDLRLSDVTPLLRRWFPTDQGAARQVDTFLAQNREDAAGSG